MAARDIVDFKSQTPEREESPINAAKLIEGQPVQVTENIYTDKQGRFFSGYWSSTPGKWHIDYAGEEEFCRLLEGIIEIGDESGATSRFEAGDEFVIPAGFKGTWTTVESCRKSYVLVVVE